MSKEPMIKRLDAEAAETALPALAAILVDAVAGGASVNFMAGYDLAAANAFWRGQLAGIVAGTRILLVAQEDDAIIGTVVITFAPQPNAPHRADIGKMLVHSGSRRQGLGRRLLAAAEAAALAHGRTTLMLDTEAGSAGDALYRRCGWTELGTVPRHSLTPDGRLASATFFYKDLTS